MGANLLSRMVAYRHFRVNSFSILFRIVPKFDGLKSRLILAQGTMRIGSSVSVNMAGDGPLGFSFES